MFRQTFQQCKVQPSAEDFLDLIQHLRLPSEIFDRPGLMAASFKPMYNLLAAIYFLNQLSTSGEITAHFAPTIEPSTRNGNKLSKLSI